MAEDDKSKSGGSPFPTFVSAGIGLAGLIGFFTLGPIDLARTAYNSMVGDVHLIRERAVQYVRQNIGFRYRNLDSNQVEVKLAEVLDYKLEDISSF